MTCQNAQGDFWQSYKELESRGLYILVALKPKQN